MAELDAPAGRAALPPEDIAVWRRHAAVVSWSAVFAGAIAAAAFGLILLTLGTGLGLASLSPWRAASASAGAFGVAAIIWVCVTQILTSGLGGYLAGRLRHRWPAVEADEVYFRDTAHGFLAWALATLATAALVAVMLPAAEHAGVQAVEKAAPVAPAIDRGNARAEMDRWPVGYYIDALFRRPAPPAAGPSASSAVQPSAAPAISAPASSAAASGAAASAVINASAPVAAASATPATPNPSPNASVASGAVVSPVTTPRVSATAMTEPTSAQENEPVATGMPPKQEVTRIFLNSLATDDPLSVADIAYVARIVSRYTGLSTQAAQVRVAATYAQLQQKIVAIEGVAKVAADRARRASVSASLWLFVSLLLGAFSASFMAIVGGRLRDV
ncbi:hypothetical protein [Trinickia dinghuensis]|uniref:Transmembrane protein n=1 Tax=Trinickia dinghuensis TaxID=2291023 RepID=A0A3D8JTE4_9BURK|nr:hypothetical protein [Trinickia dinghuensis]RDU95824.1 hypothetical protein DWV00_26575 [Trinickia dinghuensis]